MGRPSWEEPCFRNGPASPGGDENANASAKSRTIGPWAGNLVVDFMMNSLPGTTRGPWERGAYPTSSPLETFPFPVKQKFRRIEESRATNTRPNGLRDDSGGLGRGRVRVRLPPIDFRLILRVPEMIQRPISITFQHRVCFTHGAFAPSNQTLRDLVVDARGLGERSKILVLVDGGVAEANPKLVERISSYFHRHDDAMDLVSEPMVLPGGESCKNDWALVEKIWQAIEFHSICRHSYVITIGGGAFLDLAGFGAATAHRGIRLVRMPTTTLSQGDGGVGVKNGVNYFGKKNWVGTFSVPFAIVNDLDFIHSLPERAARDGVIEAIKVSLIRDRDFFEYLERNAASLRGLERAPLETLIRRSAENHVDHIATSGDPFEYGSARPLDFGHWAAHKLEQISSFRVTHGEAVAIGMAVDLLYSVEIGLLDRDTADRILDLIEAVGFDLWSDYLDTSERGQPVILAGLEEFREHLGGRLTVTLIPAIGEKLEVHEMDEAAILRSLRVLRQRFAPAGLSAKSGARID